MATNDLQGVETVPVTDISPKARNDSAEHTGPGREGTSSAALPVIPLRVAAGASVIAGLLHYAAVPEHRTEWWASAAFFTALAAFQIIWAALVWCDDRRPVLCAGLLVNAATVAVWAVSRTDGLPFGPGAGEPESIGVLDVACTLAELVTLIAVLLVLRPWRRWSVTS